MSSQFKVFHFQELNWLIYFPNGANKGKYLTYNVLLRDLRHGSSQQAKRVTLGELVESREFEQQCPHTVGFFKTDSVEGMDTVEQRYLEMRTIRTIDEFWLFLNALDI